MKTIQYLLFASIAMLTIFSSCKKEESVDLCTNGYLDPGEEEPDCGGSCAPCPFVTAPYLDLKINDVETSMITKSLTYNGTNWILSMVNDSLTLFFDLGTTGNTGGYPMPLANTNASLFGNSYPNQTDGSYAISAHDLENDLMSGHFEIKFSRIGYTDTIFVTDGVFSDYSY